VARREAPGIAQAVPLLLRASSARHPLVLRGTEKAYGVPGAAKNTGDDARPLFEN
jgi:hypothetical protein